jgi:hypothetical protein
MNMLVAALWASRWWLGELEKTPAFRPPFGAKRLINLAVPIAITEPHSGGFMNDAARDHMRQRLQSARGLWGLVHECETLAYFIRKGVTVEPHFLNKASPDELVLRWQRNAIPVQCKSKEPGAGRAISRDSFISLAGCITRDTKRAGQRLLIRIGTAGKVREADLAFIRQSVARVSPWSQGPALCTAGERTYSIDVSPVSARFSVRDAREFLAGASSYLTMLIGEPSGDGASEIQDVTAVIRIDARLKEHPWRSLRDSVDSAALQLLDGAPGLAAVHYADPMEDFESLSCEGQPLSQAMAEKIARTPGLAAVLLSCEPDIQLPGAGQPGVMRSFFLRNRLPGDFPDQVLRGHPEQPSPT